MKYKVISADSHVIEPSKLWVDYIEPKFRDRAPRVVRQEDADFWVCEGLSSPFSAIKFAVAGQRSEELRRTSRYDEILPGGWNPGARLKDMKCDGIDAEVIYPSVTMLFYRIQDVEFMQACFQSYNDWVADFCRAYSDRFAGVAVIVLDNVEWAVQELRRTAKKGFRAAMVPGTPPANQGYESLHYDPFWAEAQELEIPISLHTSTGRREELNASKYWASYATVPAGIQVSLTDLIFSRVFERFPRLRVVSAEYGIGWIGNMLERLDHFYQRYRWVRNEHLAGGKLPSDVFREHVYATFIRDRAGVTIRHQIGIDNIMWSNDYPHGDSTWPYSQKVLGDHFAGVPEEEQKKIVHDNAAKLYHLLS